MRSGWVARAAQADKVDKVYKDIQKAIDEEKVELAKKKTQEAPPPPPPAVCPPRSRAVRRTQSRGWHLQERHGVRGLGWDGLRAAVLCPPTLSEPRAEPSDVCARQVFISKQMGVKPLKKAVASKKNNVKRYTVAKIGAPHQPPHAASRVQQSRELPRTVTRQRLRLPLPVVFQCAACQSAPSPPPPPDRRGAAQGTKSGLHHALHCHGRCEPAAGAARKLDRVRRAVVPPFAREQLLAHPAQARSPVAGATFLVCSLSKMAAAAPPPLCLLSYRRACRAASGSWRWIT